ncbi:YqcI/YcgG family protein [Flavobacteriaceae bacterium TK19130]|nr:YqcI/YcgG family protein [Thermobacterium salinum]
MQSKNIHKENELAERLEDFILGNDHPCIMAQTVFKMKKTTIKRYHTLGTEASAIEIYNDIKSYLTSYDFNSNEFQTFIATFPENSVANEQEFEKLLWKQLQAIHEVDTDPWDASVSSNPDDSKFSFSIGGEAFFIVGMHPQSSRKARRTPFPVIVFNLHWQFEKLRKMGAYERVRDTIRNRDKALQGTINPVLKDYGDDTETKQYSGRAVEDDWKCPFHPSD